MRRVQYNFMDRIFSKIRQFRILKIRNFVLKFLAFDIFYKIKQLEDNKKSICLFSFLKINHWDRSSNEKRIEFLMDKCFFEWKDVSRDTGKIKGGKNTKWLSNKLKRVPRKIIKETFHYKIYNIKRKDSSGKKCWDSAMFQCRLLRKW